MGEARRRRQAGACAPQTIYHHTSALRTNLLWMSGIILPEGQGGVALHPDIGPVGHYPFSRRAFVDFPPLVWFTTRIAIPGCLRRADIKGVKDDGTEMDLGALMRKGTNLDHETLVNLFVLNRVALGFRTADIAVTPWPDHPGYRTGEGRDLNETALEAGDDPRDWFVAEEPVDLMQMLEIWVSQSKVTPRLERRPDYLPDVKAMVTGCRKAREAGTNAYIHPSWMKPEQARAAAAELGLPSALPWEIAATLERLKERES